MPELPPPTSPSPQLAPGRGVPQRWRIMAYALALVVMALVFALYVRPGMMVTLAEQLWACF